MIDLAVFRSVLSENGFITTDDRITAEVFNFLSLPSWSPSKIQRLFAPTARKQRPIPQYTVEQNCENCGALFETAFSKTSLFTALERKRKKPPGHDFLGLRPEHVFCNTCAEPIKIAIEEKRKAELESRAAEETAASLNRTADFISNFLNPDNSWNKELSSWERFSILQKSYFHCDRNQISEHIKEMAYCAFLETPYWHAIAAEVKRRAKWKCRLCASGENLRCHHSSYDNHGFEIEFFNHDLISICDDCHSKFHNIDKSHE